MRGPDQLVYLQFSHGHVGQRSLVVGERNSTQLPFQRARIILAAKHIAPVLMVGSGREAPKQGHLEIIRREACGHHQARPDEGSSPNPQITQAARR